MKIMFDAHFWINIATTAHYMYVIMAIHQLKTSGLAVKYSVGVWDHCVREAINCSIHLTMRIMLGTVLVTFLVFSVSVLESCRNGSGLLPDLWVQKFSQLWLCTWYPALGSNQFLRYLFDHSALKFLKNLVIYSLIIREASVSLNNLFPGCSCWLPFMIAVNFDLFFKVTFGKTNQQFED